MKLSAAIQKLYRPRSAPAQLVVSGSHAWVPLEMKLARVAPTCTGIATPPVDAEQTPSATTVAPAAPALPATPAPVAPSRPVRPSVPSPVKPLRQPASQQPEHDFSDCIRQPRRTFQHVGGMVDTKERLLCAAHDILSAANEHDEPRNGILLSGEPGNGKTLFAEALAGELGVPFLPVTFGDIASKWVNETPQKVKAVFNAARQAGPCVLFIDEIDSFLKARDGHTHHMDRDVTNVMLTETVALRRSKVVLVAATNYLDALDGAGVREGRFDFRIEVPPPDLRARVALIAWSIFRQLGADALDRPSVEALARRWEGFSAARLTALGNQLCDMRRGGIFCSPVTFDIGMRAMRLVQGRKGKLPENVKSVDDMIMPADSRDVLRDLAIRMREVYRLEQLGACLPRGLLFYGPPGTGKTMAAMALAKASDYAFLKTTGADLLAQPDTWQRLVREAKDIRPVIVFIDEADDILADRRYSNITSLTNRILTTLDGADGRIPDVIYIAATNHHDRLDNAAIRGGRFEEKIRFDVPDLQDMKVYVTGGLKKISDQSYTIVSGATEQCLSILGGRSIADADAVLKRAVNLAAVRALRENAAELRPSDISEAVRGCFLSDLSSG